MAEETNTLNVVEDNDLAAEFGDFEAEMQKQFAEDEFKHSRKAVRKGSLFPFENRAVWLRIPKRPN